MRATIIALLAACGGSTPTPETATTPRVIHMKFVPSVATAPVTITVEPISVKRFRKTTPVRKYPASDADKIGVVRRGTNVAVVETAEGIDDCEQWLRIEPRGWVCESELEPTTEPPTQASDVSPQPVKLGVYGIVRKDAQKFASREDAELGAGESLVGANSVRAVGAVTIDGRRYWRTSQGALIDAGSIIQISPSKFHGVQIADGAAMPAWVRGRRDSRKPVKTYGAPGGRVIGELAARSVVTILEASADDAFVRVSDTAWLDRRDLRVASLAEPPAGTADTEKWFDVDLEQQVLVAYEGARPVYATLVSTGKYEHETPSIIARIAAKHELAHMTSNKEDVYSVADVPWAMYYDGNYALHTSYWHDGFGSVRSHGCINLAPQDARFLYHWSSPDVPPGWISVFGDRDVPGSLVQIRSRKVPNPEARGYAKAMREAQPLVATSQ